MKPDSKFILKWSSQYLRTPKMYSRSELLNLVLISLLLFNDKTWDDNAFNVIGPTCETTSMTSAISISVDKHSYWPASLALLVTASRYTAPIRNPLSYRRRMNHLHVVVVNFIRVYLSIRPGNIKLPNKLDY